MKIGSYVKAAGAYGVLQGVGGVEGQEVVDVCCVGDDLPTEFWPLEVMKSRRPKSSKFRGMAARISATAPCPQAGVFTQEDLADLDARYERSRQAFNEGAATRAQRPVKPPAERVTMSTFAIPERRR
jgi:hypothetical protein